MNDRLDITICGRHMPEGYSGGRYHAWMMTEALAASGHRVTAWTDHRPYLARDFDRFPDHGSIRLHLDPDFDHPPGGPCDLLVVVPHDLHPVSMYVEATLAAARRRARLVLLNFESADWFNAYAPEPRPVSNWDGWKLVAQYADVVLSSAREGTRFARQFYDTRAPETRCLHCHPAINTPVADTVPSCPRVKRVVSITRFVKGSAHKGGTDIAETICPALRDYELAILVGAGDPDAALITHLRERAKPQGVNVVLHRHLRDRDKFHLLKSSRALIFLSYFEGFGYPPIEATYCHTPCLAYDLPVLRETCGDAVTFVERSDHEGLRGALAALLAKPPGPSAFAAVRPIASFDRYRDELDGIVVEACSAKHPPASLRASSEFLRRWAAERSASAPPEKGHRSPARRLWNALSRRLISS